MDQHGTPISIDNIEFDQSNPRIAHIFEEDQDNPPSPDEMSRALRDESSESLRRSIRQTKGIKNPIKVTPVGNNTYRVFEGNTRLSIYKAFNNKGEPGNWSTIPCVIYETIDQEGIDEILVQDHIVGTQPWSAYAKARYLHNLHTHKDYDVTQIAAMCGIGQAEILRSIETYVFMNKTYRTIIDSEELNGPSPDPFFNERKYTAFEEYIRSDARSEAVDLAGYTDEDFSRWVAKGLFTKNEDVRIIPEILKHETSRKIFLTKGTREAKKLLDTPALSKQLKEATMVSLCKAIIEKSNSTESREIKSISENQTSSMLVYDAITELKSFYDVFIADK
jgi:hypothetical protein